ncbi:hypothetical protein SAMN04515668_3758 [Hymenobacter arizonensis]|uniref:Outer membrane protein beta-barrel domain-containing protein n=2 Tax=Hymenobacter arizonensis TaxID=1227077 RepID=A0A1I6AJQ4_HYMAR|nr:hypothetical protein SAMN04515668_3758 [Hymenobacter arizonensis]
MLLTLLALAAPVAAQHVEIAGRAGVGLFRFGGQNATSNSFVLYQDLGASSEGYVNNPYGSRVGTGLALGGRVQRVGSHNGLLAFDLGYELLRSRNNINQLFYSPSQFSSFIGVYSADGSAALQSKNLTAFLGLGRRLKASLVEVDILAGPELAYIYELRDKGSGTYNGGQPWAINSLRSYESRLDLRLRADITVWYHQLGANASYSHGLLNYQSGLKGTNSEVYARILRLGLAYRLK